MQPLTARELESIADSLSNEDLLLKQCIAAASSTHSAEVYGQLTQMAMRHQQHYEYLMNLLQQHVPMAPTSPDEGRD